MSGLEVPETHDFDLGPHTVALGIARLDRSGPLRVPVHSLAGLLNAVDLWPDSALVLTSAQQHASTFSRPLRGHKIC